MMDPSQSAGYLTTSAVVVKTASGSQSPRFLTGSTMRHVVVMTFTGAIGLISIFFVDLVNILYISWLNDHRFTAALGFASAILFFQISFGAGISIGTSALVSRALGARKFRYARRLSVSALIGTFLAASFATALTVPFLEEIVALHGARGEVAAITERFLLVAFPVWPLLGIGMTSAGILRAYGDARRAMHVTLSGGILTLILDPIFIFVLDLGLDGASAVVAISRVCFAFVGLRAVFHVHRLMHPLTPRWLMRDCFRLSLIVVPAILTNIAIPFSNSFVTDQIAYYGDDAAAAWAIIGRLIPVVFGAMFSLPTAIGPIIGQNYGARSFERMRRAYLDAIIVVLVYGIAASVSLALLTTWISGLFGATEPVADLINFFSYYVSWTFVFVCLLFLSTAVFSTLGRPLWATIFGWLRATVGTIPFCKIGASAGQAKGILMGWGLGAVAFGSLAAVVGYLIIVRASRPASSLPIRRWEWLGYPALCALHRQLNSLQQGLRSTRTSDVCDRSSTSVILSSLPLRSNRCGGKDQFSDRDNSDSARFPNSPGATNMINFSDFLEQAMDNKGFSDMASSFGISEADTRKVVDALAPAFSEGLKRASTNTQNTAKVLDGFSRSPETFLDPAKAFGQEGINQGNAMLEGLFGSKDVSRAVAQQASETAGVGSELIKKLLPAIAGLVLNSFNKAGNDQSMMGGLSSAFSGSGTASGGNSWMDAIGSLVGGLTGGGGSASNPMDNLAKMFGQASGQTDANPLQAMGEIFQRNISAGNEQMDAVQKLFDQFGNAPRREV